MATIFKQNRNLDTNHADWNNERFNAPSNQQGGTMSGNINERDMCWGIISG